MNENKNHVLVFLDLGMLGRNFYVEVIECLYWHQHTTSESIPLATSVFHETVRQVIELLGPIPTDTDALLCSTPVLGTLERLAMPNTTVMFGVLYSIACRHARIIYNKLNDQMERNWQINVSCGLMHITEDCVVIRVDLEI